MLKFLCNHPAKHLAVARDATVKDVDADFEEITYHLFCRRCGTEVEIKHSNIKGTVGDFIKRGIEGEVSTLLSKT